MASLDIDAAFRRIPVLPVHKPYIVVQCRPGEFYIDHVVPFGITSGTGVQGAVMDAIVDILDARGWGPNKKWVDDLNNFRFPKGAGVKPGTWVYAHTLEDIFRLAAELGIQWHLIKCTDYGYVGVYLGFLWDLPGKAVSLPEKKRLKYLARTQEFLEQAEQGQRVDLQTVMKLSGSLTHITFVYPLGRAYLPNLCTFIASFKNKFAPRYPPHSVISDVRWWRVQLQVPGVKRSLNPRGPLQDFGVSVDASTDWGIGIVVDGCWDAWKWSIARAGWNTEGRDIGWAEMVAIELVVRRLEELGISDADVLVRSDNQGVVGGFRRGRSRNYQVNLSIRRTEIICISRNLRIKLEYVNTKVNQADAVSRGTPLPEMARFRSDFVLPEELAAFLVHA